jgi:hypothetical protein
MKDRRGLKRAVALGEKPDQLPGRGGLMGEERA